MRGAEELKLKKKEDKEEEAPARVSKCMLVFLIFVVAGSVVVPIFMKIGSGSVF